MTTRLELPAALRAQILCAAGAAAPGECCGLVEGVWVEGAGQDGAARVLALHPARNLSPRPDRFELDPRDHFAALRGARANGHAIIGCYHSHPGGLAKPSASDLAGAGEEDFLWLIAAGDALAAFVYRGGGFAPVALAGSSPAWL